jgi:hypothetical protein
MMSNRTQVGSLSIVLALALVLLFSPNLAAQSQTDESQAAPTTGTIRGRVLSDTGHPLSGASVALRGSTPFFQPRVTATDTEGNFQVSGLYPELYGLSAFAPGYVSPPRELDTQPIYYRIGETADLVLVKGGVITGSVMSVAGEPVVQIGVRAMLIREANGQPPPYPSTFPRLTDDRGVYRIYGLVPGTYLVSAGGRNSFGPASDVFETDSATYAPSSTRDTAVEVVVRAGEESTGVDIRYRAEPGRLITGVVVGQFDPTSNAQPSVNLIQIVNGIPFASVFSFPTRGGKGFSFHGVSDGDYDLVAQYSIAPGEVLISDPRRITVKGADLSGIELLLKPLGSIAGRVTLENSVAPECRNKRRPLFAETLVVARRAGKAKDQPRQFAFLGAQDSPAKSGEFLLRNLAPNQYNLNTRFFAKYWFVRSILREAATSKPAPRGPANQALDIARNGLNLKSGERASGISITLAEGAASIRGTIKLAPGESVPPKLFVHLVPAEKENAEDVLRVFASAVSADGNFAFNNLPPGNYWTLVRVAVDSESPMESRIRQPDEAELRLQIRRAVEAGKKLVELKPCQNFTDYQLPSVSAPR